MKKIGIFLAVIISLICIINICNTPKNTSITSTEIVTNLNEPIDNNTHKSTPPTVVVKLTSTKVNSKDKEKMILIPSGNFLMGTNEEQLSKWLKVHKESKRDDFKNEIPQRNVYLNDFYIYKYEVTVLQYRKFCKETNREMPTTPYWGWIDTHPIVNVRWDDANDYAKWAGVSLPTEAQWEKAARGIDGRLYPWGNKWSIKKCVNETNKTKPVGSILSGASPYGVMDMTGNAWEFCADWYSDDYYQSAPSDNPTGPETGTNHVSRGGSWYNFYCDPYGDGFRCADRSEATPYTWGEEGNTEGFRCVLNLK